MHIWCNKVSDRFLVCGYTTDDNGNVVDVEIIPETVDADLTLTSSSKTVPIKVMPKDDGKLALGYAISSLTPSSNSIEIYCNDL